MLEFIFIAELFNGTIYKQTPDDISLTTPGRSAYYDIKNVKIRRFSLVGKGHIFTIDLESGNLEVDGNKIYTKKPPEKSELRLIYYRQVQQHMQVGVDDDKVLTPTIRYFIGWQTTIKDKNYKFEIGLD